MRLPSSYRCNGCGRLKETTNHWWVLLEHDKAGPALSIFSFTAPQFDSESAQHLCSESCLTKAVSKWMQQNQQKPKEK